MGASHFELTQSLADAFNELADEAQGLNDRRIVLEHKLRFAHEQLQYLADKYAPATPEITEALANLQLPPHNAPIDENSSVPLPRRGSPKSQHQVALVIRDGRRVASQLASLGEASKTTGSTRNTSGYSHTSEEERSSMSTALEQDFTVQGRKGNLDCPFQQPPADGDKPQGPEDNKRSLPPDTTPHRSSDPICAAMYEEATSQTTGAQDANGSRCPIRFLDQHSAEEIAHYVETHKHELPRSHEVCLRRYQHNEEQIRKLDNKYGSMINMIEDLGQLHQPMLPESQQGQPRRPSEVDEASNERVKDWAQAITETAGSAANEVIDEGAEGDDRESRFDRPMKEVRVGESPSRPWGISVPVFDSFGHDQVPFSPPPAPVRMPSPARSAKTPAKKCPFDHTKMQAMAARTESHQRPKSPTTPQPSAPCTPVPAKESGPQPTPLAQPAFINPESVKATPGTPQMVFTGPVFIGYPVEQAMQIMSQYRPSNP